MKTTIMLLLSAIAIQVQAQTTFGLGFGLDVYTFKDGDSYPFVTTIVPNSPADESNLCANAVIKSINGADTKNKTVAEALQMLKSTVPTTFTLSGTLANREFTVKIVSAKYYLVKNNSFQLPSLVPFKMGEKWGYATANKTLVIPAEYDGCQAVRSNRCIARASGGSISWGTTCAFVVMDTLGKKIFADSFQYLNFFDATRFIFTKKGKAGLMDLNGKILLAAKYKNIEALENGVAIVKGDNGKYGLISENGLEIIFPKYDLIKEFHNHRAYVELGDQYGYIDESGKLAIPMLAKSGISEKKFSNGLVVFKSEGKYGYKNTAGTIVIEAKYDYAEDFKNGIGVVRSNGWYGTVDKSGKELSGFVFESVSGGYSGGFLAVAKEINDESKYGYVNAYGEQLLSFDYYFASEFHGSYAVVRLSPDYGSGYNIINMNGTKKLSETDDITEINLKEDGFCALIETSKGSGFALSPNFNVVGGYKYNDITKNFVNGLLYVSNKGNSMFDNFYVDAKGTEYYDSDADKKFKEKEKLKDNVNDTTLLDKNKPGIASIAKDDILSQNLTNTDLYLNIKDAKHYTDKYVMHLNAGERIWLKYSSFDFDIVCILQDPEGKYQLLRATESAYGGLFSGEFDTTIQNTGNYTLLVTSTEPETTGKYSITKYLVNKFFLVAPASSELCKNLDFLMEHAEADFHFIKGEKTEISTFLGKEYEYTSDLKILNSIQSKFVSGFLGDKFEAIIAENSDLATAKTAYAYANVKLKSCLMPKFTTKEKNSEADKEWKTQYTEANSFFNAAEVEMKWDSGKSKYVVKIIVGKR